MFITDTKYKILSFLLYFFIVFYSINSNAQSYKNIFLDWDIIDDNLYLDDNIYNFHEDLFITKQYCFNSLIKNIKIEDTLYIDCSKQEEFLLSKYNVLDNISITYQFGINRKKSCFIFDILPIRKNKKNGKLQKLFSFNIIYDNVDGDNIIKKQVNSIFNTGVWYKISTDKNGVYKISYQDLIDFGIDVTNIDPRNIRIYGNGGGMLPESNNVSVFTSPQEKSIFVSGESDGVFNTNDYILFYGQSADTWGYDLNKNCFVHKNNLYNDDSYYFLNYDLGLGQRIESVSNLNNPGNMVNYFNNFMFYENDLVNFIKSGSNWYGESFGLNNLQSFNFNISGLSIIDTARIKVKLADRAVSPNSCFFTLSGGGMNQVNTPSSSVGSDYLDPYVNLHTVDQLFLPNQTNLSFDILLNSFGVNSDGWLDYIELNYREELRYSGSQILFRDIETVSLSNNITQFNVNNTNNEMIIWDVTNPIKPINHDYDYNSLNSLISFCTETDSLKEFVCFKNDDTYSVQYKGLINNQNLSAISDIDFIIITSEELLSEAQRLANFHMQQDGLLVEVVTDTEIFNEFSSGSVDISGIRNFIKHVYNNSSLNLLKYLLIFGDGSYDPRNRASNNDSYILTYQSSNSIDPISSYVSDDFFGLLDNNEGLQNSNNVNFMDIGIGRMPVTTIQEAIEAVDKIISFYHFDTFGEWKNNICFVGDDKDESWDTNHSLQADAIADYVFDNHLRMNVNKIYLDSYIQEVSSGGQRCPDVNMAINRKIEKGSMLINYTGHGGELGWAHERILGIDDVNSWNNKDKLPLFLTATCEFSRFDDPDRLSAGEHVFLRPESGAIALLSTTRVVYSAPNYDLNYAFIDNIFDYNNIDATIGDLIRITKNNVPNKLNQNHRNFTLFGDPALSLKFPKNTVILSQHPDTIKAYGEYVFDGHIVDQNNNIISNFNGELSITVFDKKRIVSTLGQDESNIFSYNIQDNIIFKGKASVIDGLFSFNFIVPRDINYSFDFGKFSFYAKGESGNNFIDATGFNDNIIIGGTDNNIIDDSQNIGPIIDLFMNDTNFISGGITDESPVFISHLFDEHGINTIGNGIGHDIVAILDDDYLNPIILNNYYESDIDNYQSGKVYYQLYNLSEGQHKINFKVWDIFNMSSEQEIFFNVINSENITTESHVFPNPAIDNIAFYFNNNQNANEIELNLEIFSSTGKHIKSLSYIDNGNTFRFGPILWDCRNDKDKKVAAGVYIFRATMIYKFDNTNSTDFSSGKIVIIN